MGAIIEIKNISKIFYKKEMSVLAFNFMYDVLKSKKKAFHALNNINLNVEKGKILGFVGQNGAGKTTLMKIMTQVILPDSGNIFFEGKNILKNKNTKKYIISSDMAIFDLFDATMALKFYADLYDMNISYEDIEEILKKVSLKDHQGLPINKYSSGMVQKLKFAKIMMLDPKVILFDEPTSALDAISTKMTRELILKLKRQGKTIIITTHNMDEIDKLCDDVAIIDKGIIIKKGNLNKIKKEFNTDNFEDAYISVVGKL